MDFRSWTGKLGIENYINDVDTYHQKIIDKNNATKKKIDTIFQMCSQWIQKAWQP